MIQESKILNVGLTMDATGTKTLQPFGYFVLQEQRCYCRNIDSRVHVTRWW
jgi:hypothetical protein